MSQKISAPTIKLTGIEDDKNDLYIPLDQLGIINANGRRYDPVAVRNALNNLPVDRRYFSALSSYPYSRKSMLTQYLDLMPDNVAYRGTPAQRHPFMREMALRFGVALESSRLGSHRQPSKSSSMYYRLALFHNHYLNEVAAIKASKPIPIDLTRYLKLLTGKDVWSPFNVKAWTDKIPGVFSGFGVYDVESGKYDEPDPLTLMYPNVIQRMNPWSDMKLYLGSVVGSVAGMPWRFDNHTFSRGPYGYWPAVIEYGMARNGPAFTDQMSRERLAKPKKGRA
jgi:hypothetical protein